MEEFDNLEEMTSKPEQMGMYVLDENNNPVFANNISEWGLFMNDVEKRRVAFDCIAYNEKCYLSTMFLGLDQTLIHTRMFHTKPCLWETMIIGGPHAGQINRYISEESAKEGHKEMLEMLQTSEEQLKFNLATALEFEQYELAEKIKNQMQNLK